MDARDGRAEGAAVDNLAIGGGGRVVDAAAETRQKSKRKNPGYRAALGQPVKARCHKQDANPAKPGGS